jgi:hypothetical protein
MIEVLDPGPGRKIAGFPEQIAPSENAMEISSIDFKVAGMVEQSGFV